MAKRAYKENDKTRNAEASDKHCLGIPVFVVKKPGGGWRVVAELAEGRENYSCLC